MQALGNQAKKKKSKAKLRLWNDEQKRRGHVFPFNTRLKRLIILFVKRKHKKDMSQLYNRKRTERANRVFLF